MLHTSQPTVYVRVYVRHGEQPRRPPGIARCLFGKPNPNETKRICDEELANNYKKFLSRYEVCSTTDRRSPSKTSSSSLVSSAEDSRRQRLSSSTSRSASCSPRNEPKKQKLLTEYWPKSSNNSRNKKS